jgi:hypothetical protein
MDPRCQNNDKAEARLPHFQHNRKELFQSWRSPEAGFLPSTPEYDSQSGHDTSSVDFGKNL